MFIKSIRFSNYRSFHTEQTVEFGDKNIIIGKNGAGKSNFLRALTKIFLVSENKSDKENNEGTSTIELNIDNVEKRFPFPTYFTIAIRTRNGFDEYELNKKNCEREELASILENAGLNTNNIVMQGRVTKLGEMNALERYTLLCEVSGIEKYNRSRDDAFKYLNDENEGKIENMLLKLEVNTRRTEDMRKKHEEYEQILEARKGVEYEIIVNDIYNLNLEIERIEADEKGSEGEVNEGLVEYELKECRTKICETRAEADELHEYLKKVDSEVLEKIQSAIIEANSFNNTTKTNNISIDNTDTTNIHNTITTNIDNINPFFVAVETLEKKKNELLAEYELIKREESKAYVDIQAEKYWEASQGKESDLVMIKKRLEETRVEIEASKNKHLNNNTMAIDRKPIDRISNNNISYMSNDDLMRTRKKLWIQEKGLRDELKNAKDETKGLWNKLLHVGRQSVNIYEEIRNEKGVCGMVFELLSVPDEMHAAYEAVGRGGLFWIVVEDEGVASRLVKHISGRATFAALNVIDKCMAGIADETKISDDRLLRLSDAVKCDSRYRSLARYLCKDYYVCCDVTNALRLGEQHKVNTVTLDGDMVAKSGAISGGYEAGCPTVQELLRSRRREVRLQRGLDAIKRELDNLTEKLLAVENVTDSQRQYENLLAYEKYLLRIIGKDNTSNGSNALVHRTLKNKIRQIEERLEQIRTDLERESNRKERHDGLVKKVLAVRALDERIVELQNEEKKCIDKLYGRPSRQFSTLENVNKHVLVDRRNALMARIGATQLASLIRPILTRDELTDKLRGLNKELKKYSGYERVEVLADNYSELSGQLIQLKGAKDKILRFIEHLDNKKNETLRLTFGLIAGNYSYYYERLTGRRSELKLSDNAIEIIMDGIVVDTRMLSGGQKSCVSLSLIFAIQKNDPAPFYIFDEVDANLDVRACQALYTLLRTESAQYFVTTFKEESLSCGDRFYGVAVENKSSFIGEIDQSLAVETLRV